MAAYLVKASGSRGEVQRLGGAQGGVRATLAGWHGAVAVRAYDREGIPWLEVRLVMHRGQGREGAIYDGPYDDAPTVA